MGIKGLFRWIQAYIPSAIKKKRVTPDTLFIDAKQFFYSAIANLKTKRDGIPIFLKILKKEINSYLPTDTLFISMDGPNPAAKFQTQRTRKFQIEYNVNFQYPKQPFNMLEEEQMADVTNREISIMLQNLIKNLNFRCKRILFSSGFSPGESEHKYLDFFREYKKSENWKPNQIHYIDSQDNDLVFLALQFIDEDFFIARKFNEIIDISEIRKYFFNKFYNPQIGLEKFSPKEFDEQKLINDIIALSFLLGNDFIPSIRGVSENLHAYVAADFDNLFKAYFAINYSKTGNSDAPFKYLIEHNCFNVEVLKQLILNFSNKTCFPPVIGNLEHEKQKAQAILRTFNFTYLMYTSKLPSWTYYYPYLDHPDLLTSVSLMTQEGPEFFDTIQSDEVIDPYLKALVIHPAQSMQNIPWNIYKIKIPPSPIAEKFWPLRRNKPPMFDLQEIMVHYKQQLATLSPEELVLNRRDPPYFEYTRKESTILLEPQPHPNPKNKKRQKKTANKTTPTTQNQQNNEIESTNEATNANEGGATIDDYNNNKNNEINNDNDNENEGNNDEISFNDQSVAILGDHLPKNNQIKRMVSKFGKIKQIRRASAIVIEFENSESAAAAGLQSPIIFDGRNFPIITP